MLTVGKSGIKREVLRAGGCSAAADADKPPGPPQSGQPPCGHVMMMFSPEKTQLEGRKVSIAALLDRLSSFVDRPIIDKTGYGGTLDVKLEFAPDRAAFGLLGGAFIQTEAPPPDENASVSLFTAVRERLGLRLGSARGPVDVIVISHVERPTPN